MKKLATYDCLRCGEKNIPARKLKIIRCGRCRSPYWDKPYTSKSAEEKAKQRREQKKGELNV